MILVTGGTGIVGAYLLMALSKEETAVRALYRTQEKIEQTKKVFGYFSSNPEKLLAKIEWVKADINSPNTLETAFEGIQYVYHAAALVSFDPRDDKNLLKTNVGGTANVVNLCIKNKVKKLAFVSSIAALGSSTHGNAITEETEWTHASTAYAISKHYGEMEVWRASQEGVAVVIVNPGIIVAAGFWRSSSGRFFKQASMAPNYYLPSGTGFVGVDEVVSALIELMQSDIQNERFILVNQNWTYKKFAHVLAEGLGKKVPKKEIRPWMLSLFWRWDWLRSTFWGKRRILSKAAAQLFETRDLYDNSKLKKALNFEYEDLEVTTKDYCAIYLKEFEG